MPAAAFGELNNSPSDRLLIGTRRTFGYSVRKKKLWTGPAYDYPTRLQLLYIALDPGSKLTVRHLEIDGVDIDNIAAMESVLFLEARANVTNGTVAPHLKSTDFEPIIFTRPSFFTIAIDEQAWQLYFPADKKEAEVIAGETHDPIVFIDKKTVVESATPDGSSITAKIQDFEENYAFHDAKRVAIQGRDAVRIINFFTDEMGNVLERTANFGFEIFLRAPCAGSQHLTTIIIDPDGQNQGPPV